ISSGWSIAPVKEQTREHRAYHEAGHAVVGYLVHHRPLKISLAPEGRSMGRTVHIMPSRTDRPPSRPWIDRHILYLWAGLAAERNFDSEADDAPSDDDRLQAYEYADQLLRREDPAKLPYVGSVD